MRWLFGGPSRKAGYHSCCTTASPCPPAAPRYCDVLPFDDNRVKLGQPAFAGSSSGGAGGPGSGGAPPGGQPSRAADSNGPPAAAAAAAVANDYVNASPLQPSTDGDVPWAYIASQVRWPAVERFVCRLAGASARPHPHDSCSFEFGGCQALPLCHLRFTGAARC